MKGIKTKRDQRRKGSTKAIEDNSHRTKFLLFLTQCWVLSGASEKESEISSLNRSLKSKQALIHEMESAISQALSDFVFLGYTECRFGNLMINILLISQSFYNLIL